MSPLPLRRYRAERLLRQEFEGRRAEVLAAVRRRLRAQGMSLDGGDLEACYAQAWQSLYAALLAGREVANPLGWLTVVTFRRAIDECRARARAAEPRAGIGAEGDGIAGVGAAAIEPDLAAELDDRTRLRQLFEGLRGSLSARECEAASLCYLQGLTRAQAAARMGIGEPAMRKLMEGRGPGRPGVAGKVGELLRTIRGGGWCEQQASLMRGLAFGILDPAGERYRLARLHQRECPACRAYVLSLRGLAAVLPPLPLPWGLGLAAAVGRGAAAKAGLGTGARAGSGASAKAGAGAGTISASGAASAGGAAGAGVAGGGWLMTGGSVGAKLAVSCLLVLGVGCVAVAVAPRHAGVARRHLTRREEPGASAEIAQARAAVTGSGALGGALSGGSPATGVRHVSKAAPAIVTRRTAAPQVQREFGLERAAVIAAASSSGQPAAVTAHAASVGREGPAGPAVRPAATPSDRPSDAAEREFGPG